MVLFCLINKSNVSFITNVYTLILFDTYATCQDAIRKPNKKN